MRGTLSPLSHGRKLAVAAAATFAAAAAMLFAAAPSHAWFYAEPVDGPLNSGCTRSVDGLYFSHGGYYDSSFWTPYGMVTTRHTCLDGVWH